MPLDQGRGNASVPAAHGDSRHAGFIVHPVGVAGAETGPCAGVHFLPDGTAHHLLSSQEMIFFLLAVLCSLLWYTYTSVL